MIDELIVWLIDILIQWSPKFVICWLIDWLTIWCIDWLSCWLAIIKCWFFLCQVNGKSLKGRHIVGICAQRFHTVLYTVDTVFTVGLNAGQLGKALFHKYPRSLLERCGLKASQVDGTLLANIPAALRGVGLTPAKLLGPYVAIIPTALKAIILYRLEPESMVRPCF